MATHHTEEEKEAMREEDSKLDAIAAVAVSYTHLRAHETKANLVCRLRL